MKPLTCFKAYYLRGRLGEELNEETAESVGRTWRPKRPLKLKR